MHPRHLERFGGLCWSLTVNNTYFSLTFLDHSTIVYCQQKVSRAPQGAWRRKHFPEVLRGIWQCASLIWHYLATDRYSIPRPSSCWRNSSWMCRKTSCHHCMLLCKHVGHKWRRDPLVRSHQCQTIRKCPQSLSKTVKLRP